MKTQRYTIVTGTVILALCTAVFATACGGSSSGHTRSYVSHGAGYRGYYHDPWRYGRPVYVDDIGPGIEHEPPVAAQMPEMGMPDFGGMDMDMGGFDF